MDSETLLVHPAEGPMSLCDKEVSYSVDQNWVKHVHSEYLTSPHPSCTQDQVQGHMWCYMRHNCHMNRYSYWQIKWDWFFLLPSFLFPSCKTSQWIQISAMQSTSDKKTVFVNFIYYNKVWLLGARWVNTTMHPVLWCYST